MEMRVKAPRDGKVVEFKVNEGDSILEHDVIGIIE